MSNTVAFPLSSIYKYISFCETDNLFIISSSWELEVGLETWDWFGKLKLLWELEIGNSSLSAVDGLFLELSVCGLFS